MFQTKTFIERIPKCKCVGYVANAGSDCRLFGGLLYYHVNIDIDPVSYTHLTLPTSDLV